MIFLQSHSVFIATLTAAHLSVNSSVLRILSRFLILVVPYQTPSSSKIASICSLWGSLPTLHLEILILLALVLPTAPKFSHHFLLVFKSNEGLKISAACRINSTSRNARLTHSSIGLSWHWWGMFSKEGE